MNALILNVDDNEPALYAKSRILRQAAFEVVEAETGAGALERVRVARPQLVLLDMNLPDMPGLEVCRRIKSDPVTANTLVLQISATYAGRADRVRGLEEGADGYLTEPVEATELIATIRAFLRLQKAEQAQRESEAKYRTLIESLTDGVYVGQHERFVFANEALPAMLGYTVAELVGMPIRAVIAPEFQAVWGERFRRCADESRDSSRTQEIRLLRKNSDEPLWAEMRCRPMLYNGNAAVLGTLRDVTERRRMEQALRERTEALVQQDRNKDEFLAMLAHELRNPLAPLSTALEILASDRVTPRDAASLHAMMRRQVGQLVRLVNDLLDVSRVTRGKINLEMVPTDLREVINQALETSRPLIDARRHRLQISVPPEPLVVNGDATRLTQVFLNLINNAAKYTDEAGFIEIAAAIEDGAAVVRVRDNGRGISAALMPRIFDLFIQADRTLQRSQGGLGIGLTLVRRLVQEHGGEVTAVSEGPGRGSEFTVRLPLLAHEGAMPVVQKSEPAAVLPLRILVLDDNADTATSCALLLESFGHEVRALTDPSQVVDTVRAFRPHIALLDIGMPGVSGLEVAAELRAHFDPASLILVAVSGYSDPRSRQLIDEAGFDHALVKPLSVAALQTMLASIRAAQDTKRNAD